MTVSNIQLLIGVYDSGKKFANFDRKIKMYYWQCKVKALHFDVEHNRDQENPKN